MSKTEWLDTHPGSRSPGFNFLLELKGFEPTFLTTQGHSLACSRVCMGEQANLEGKPMCRKKNARRIGPKKRREQE